MLVWLLSTPSVRSTSIAEYIGIDDVVGAIFDYMGEDLPEMNYMTDKQVRVQHRAADTTRAEELLGWESEYTLEDGLAETIDWHTARLGARVRAREFEGAAARAVTYGRHFRDVEFQYDHSCAPLPTLVCRDQVQFSLRPR